MKHSGIISFTALLLLSGCATPSAQVVLNPTLPYQALDAASNAAVDKVALSDRLLADGRLEVVCVLKNRTPAAISITVTCVFEDAEGKTLAEPSVSQTTTLTDSIPLSVRFESKSKDAKRYSVQVKLNA